MTVAGLLLAAGEGRRLGGTRKAKLVLGGKTLLAHGVERLAAFVDEIVMAVAPGDLEKARADIAHAQPKRELPLTVIEGGATRQDTMRKLLASTKAEWVLIHEVARPFTPADAFARVLAVARQHGGAALSRKISVRDSIGVTASDGRLARTVARAQLVSLQTPLAFRRAELVCAHERAVTENWNDEGTAALALHAGLAVHLVDGTTENLKITYPEDWKRAQAMNVAI